MPVTDPDFVERIERIEARCKWRYGDNETLSDMVSEICNVLKSIKGIDPRVSPYGALESIVGILEDSLG